MSLFKGMCALTGMANKLMEQRPMFMSDLKAKDTTTNTQAPRTNSNRRQSRGSQSRESGSCF